jgi:NAD(P)-dependent dehydrogenase (short-subunit alcohol dehydrogenase family)
MPTALVTGGAHGLGLEVARQLVVADHDVVVSARDPSVAAAAAAELGPRASGLPVGLDVTDPVSVATAAKTLAERPGRLDVLVNNAAAFVDWAETGGGADLAVAHQVMETNLFGAWRGGGVLRDQQGRA